MPPIKEEKIIMYDSPEAAREVVMYEGDKKICTGYLSIDNFFFQKEDMARYKSCTHKTCDCGKPMKKYHTKCDVCRGAIGRDNYLKKEFREWNGTDMLCIYGDDTFFHDEESIADYCEEHACNGSDLRLVICEPNKLKPVNEDYWQDVAPEEVDKFLPEEVQNALMYLNVAIDNAAPVSWRQGKYRTMYNYTPESLTENKKEATDENGI